MDKPDPRAPEGEGVRPDPPAVVPDAVLPPGGGPASAAPPGTPPNPVLEFFASLGVTVRRPYVTRAVLVISVAVFAVMVASGVSPIKPSGEDILKWGGNLAPVTTSGQWWRLLSAVFVHVGLMHLAFNMLVIVQIGDFMERLLGHAGMAILYLGAGLGGSLASIFAHGDVVSAGASGAGWGLYGGLLGVLLTRRHLIPAPVVKGLRRAAMIFIIYNVVFSMLPGVDFAAHLGGLISGVALGMGLPLGLGEQRRGVRQAIVALLTVVALTAGAAAAPRLGAVFDDLAAVEKTTIERYNDVVRKNQAGQISDAELGAVVQREILPPWHAARVRLEKTRGLTKRLRTYGEYMKLREEAWELLVKAVGTRSEADFEAARALGQRADQTLQDLTQPR